MRRGPVGGAVLLALTALVATTALATPVTTARPTRALIDVRLGVHSQRFDVAPTGAFVAVIEVPDSVDVAEVSASTLVITAYNRVTTRGQVAAAISGDLPRAIDSVDLAAGGLPITVDGGLQVVVPIETATRTMAALQLPRAGLYPVILELVTAGEVLADVLTFVQRLPDAGTEAPPDMPVAVVARTATPLTLDDDGQVLVGTAASEELGAIADLLDTSPVPITIELTPAMIERLGEGPADSAALLGQLRTGLAGDRLLSAPSYPLDPSAAAAAGEQERYTQWLREGEDMLAVLTDEPTDRSVVLVNEPLTGAGARLVRDLGARLAVLTSSEFDALPESPGVFGDTSLLVRLSIGSGVALPATVVDRSIAATIAAATDPELTAIYAVADLVAARQQILDADADPSRHGITVGTEDLSLPDPVLLDAICSAIATTAGLEAVAVGDFAVRTDDLRSNGARVDIALPETTTNTLADRAGIVEGLEYQVTTTSSMLPPDSARIAEWNRLVNLLLTSAFTEQQVATIAGELDTEMSTLRGAVQVPEGFAFTLTGRGSELPVKIGNSSAVPLTVTVRMTSPKLRFPAGSQTVTLPPGQFTDVQVPIEARANGTFPVYLQVFTPDGAQQLGPTVQLTATINALSGLGNLITGALGLVILTWWARHVRRHRRAKQSLAVTRRHPVAGIPADRQAGDQQAGDLPTGERRRTVRRQGERRQGERRQGEQRQGSSDYPAPS